jgi:peptide-methionine (R)-S-oxide reductase
MSQPSSVDRRSFLTVSGLALVGVAVGWRPLRAAGGPKLVTIVEFTDAGVRGETTKVPKLVKTDAEWRAQLSPMSYRVTRHADTERPFTGETWNNHEPGLYRCVCCDTALYSSDTKFDSGTGWPSFWAPLAKQNVTDSHDFSLDMERIAISCTRCDAHLGHVFDDGPRPTGLRYCMNSAAMRFVKRA